MFITLNGFSELAESPLDTADLKFSENDDDDAILQYKVF